MFHKARITLTIWYLLIIMAISIAFSAVIYYGSTHEFDRALRAQRYRLEHPELHIQVLPGNQFRIERFSPPSPADTQVIEDAEKRILEELIGVNTIIFMISAIAGYFLAGRTLRPIQEMVDEQNRFVTDASHELNTPLTSMKTAIEVNLRDKHLSLDAIREVLKSNLEEIENLESLSAELILLTHYEERKHVQLATMSLPEVVEKAVEKVTALAKSKHIQITTKIAAIEMQGDERSITELLVILLDNAIKYSPAKKNISITGIQQNDTLKIDIEDQGVGIEEKDLPYIFDRFYRADKSRSKKDVKGYGLGLSIAKRIVGLHKGTITVKSVVGKGTTFTVSFPKKK